MKLSILILSCMILAANAVTFVRDVTPDVSVLFTEPKKDYLPPQQTQDITIQAIAHEPLLKVASNEELASDVIEAVVREAALEDTVVLGDQGYEYKKPALRNHRDVSHLKFGYLPPFHLPSTKYLPPSTSKITEEQNQSKEYLPPLSQTNEFMPGLSSNETSEELLNREPQPHIEYLPPAILEELGTTSEDLKSQVEAISDAVLDAATKIDKAVKAEIEGSENIAIASCAEGTTTAAAAETANVLPDSVEETAVFAKDGYHYKAPCEIPVELPAAKPIPSQSPIAVTREYLPTLQKGVREAEAKSSLLAEDGYHYHIIKQIF